MSSPRDTFLVIGGSGFLGRHIVQQLLDRGDSVSVFDIVQRYHDVPFYSGDISEQDQVAAALRKSGATCVIHTASPPHGMNDPALYWKVNVDGTNAVIAAAKAERVRKLVFTSSAGVVFNGADIIDADERLPYPEQPLDAYNETKAKAEVAVLAANGKDGLLTVALRPAGIFGPGDRQAMTGFYEVYKRGQTHFQIGDNTNLFDWTYVGNVAKAHLLAADKLKEPLPVVIPGEKDDDHTAESQLLPEESKIINYCLPAINLTTSYHPIPTSESRPLGPYVTPPPNAEKLEAAFAAALIDPASEAFGRPVVRTRFDPFSESSLIRQKLMADGVSPLQVCGQAFFITNGEPTCFWDFARAIWHRLDAIYPEKRKNSRKTPFVMSKSIGLAAATGAEWFGWLVGKEPAFTKYKVTYTCASRWHNIEKARRLLGYEPEVSLEEGLDRMITWWKEEHAGGKAGSS